MEKTTLTKILETNLDAYLASHQLPLHHIKSLESYRDCRTPRMGSHSQYCQNGHLMGVWYDSCKRRGCPQCLGFTSEQWLEKQRKILLAETHHHWVFTLPHELLAIWRFNKGLVQGMLFSAVSATLKTLSKDATYMIAQPAFMLTVHTWGRNLSLHPHIHCLIAHGGLKSTGEWINPHRTIMFPAKVMMQLFRGKLISALRTESGLVLPGDMNTKQFQSLLNKISLLDWVVHCCKPYRHGNGVVTYLSRYVKGGPFKSKQLRRVGPQHVRIGYNSHQTGTRTSIRLSTEEFLSRVCNHIPEKGKQTARFYGLYHSSQREKLNKARESQGQKPVESNEDDGITWQEYLSKQKHVPRCNICNAPLEGIEDIHPEEMSCI